ncbi:MAG: hypothetical protein ACFFE8_14010 [Candidatus Heimdallarchaeota archaeon]
MIPNDISIIDLVNIGFFGIVIGAFETTTNLVYLLSDNYNLSKKQHSFELPKKATESEIRRKVIQMFCLGVFLLLIAAISLFLSPLYFFLASGAFVVSGAIDYLRFGKFGVFLTWIIVGLIPMILLVVDWIFVS